MPRRKTKDMLKKLTETAAEQANPKLESCSWSVVWPMVQAMREDLQLPKGPAWFFDGDGRAHMCDGSVVRRVDDDRIQALVSDAEITRRVLDEIDGGGDVLFWEADVPVLKYDYQPRPFSGEMMPMEWGKWHRSSSIEDGLPGLPSKLRSGK